MKQILRAGFLFGLLSPFLPAPIRAQSVSDSDFLAFRPTEIAGRHRVQWNGRTTHGGEVASGVYFGRLEVGFELADTRAITVIK